MTHDLKDEFGKITKAELGVGGYQDAMFGVTFTLSLGGFGGSVGDFWGTWSGEPHDNAAWTASDQDMHWATMVRRLAKLMQDARALRLGDLVGTPIVATMEGNRLVTWRVLTEVL